MQGDALVSASPAPPARRPDRLHGGATREKPYRRPRRGPPTAAPPCRKHGRVAKGDRHRGGRMPRRERERSGSAMRHPSPRRPQRRARATDGALHELYRQVRDDEDEQGVHRPFAPHSTDCQRGERHAEGEARPAEVRERAPEATRPQARFSGECPPEEERPVTCPESVQGRRCTSARWRSVLCGSVGPSHESLMRRTIGNRCRDPPNVRPRSGNAVRQHRPRDGDLDLAHRRRIAPARRVL